MTETTRSMHTDDIYDRSAAPRFGGRGGNADRSAGQPGVASSYPSRRAAPTAPPEVVSEGIAGYFEPASSVRMTMAGADEYATWK